MLTADRIQSCIADLEAGRLPDRGELAELCAAWGRMRAGVPFSVAICRKGSVYLSERDSAIRALAEGLEGGLWKQAGILELRLMLEPLNEAHRDAVRAGARQLTRERLYQILKDG